MVMQIHGRLTTDQRNLINKKDYDAPPLLKVYFNDGKIEVAYKVLKKEISDYDQLLKKNSWHDAPHFFFEEPVGKKKFNLKIEAKGHELRVWLNGIEKIFINADLKFWSFDNYFKAGNYLTTSINGASSEVHYYTLEISH